MSREDDFIPWYRRATAGWLELSGLARGVLVSISMELNPKTGELTLRRGLPSLAILIRLPWEIIEPALAELVAAGKLEWDGSRFVLFDPEYTQRKRKSSTERMAEKRARDKSKSAPPPCDASDVTSVTHPPCDASDGPFILSPLISSDLISEKIPEEDPSARAPAPTEPTEAIPPTWWDAACETVESGTGTPIQRKLAWLRYFGHRKTNGKRITRSDAVYWLTTVDVREAQKERQAAADKREREAKWDRQRAGPGTLTEPRVESEAEREANAQRFAARLAAGRAKGAA